MCFHSPKAPAAPDYAAAAREQGIANEKAATQSNVSNNPNIISPYGNQTVTWNSTGAPGNVPQATVTQTLTPEAQATLEAQQRVQNQFANLGETGIRNAQNTLSQAFNPNLPNLQTSVANSAPLSSGPNANNYNAVSNVSGNTYGQAGGVNPNAYGQAGSIAGNAYGQAGGVNPAQYGHAQQQYDTSGVAAMPVNAGTTGQAAIMSRLQPQIQQQQEALAQQLANQGITPGSEAYNNAMRTQGNQQNDLLTQAALQGLNLDMSANAQGFGQAAQRGAFYNQGQNQNFGQGITAKELQNASIAQNFGQGLSSQNQQNAAIGQNFGQGATAQEQQNSAIGQNFGQGMTAQNAGNAANAQNFGQASTSAGMQNAVSAQQQNQDIQAAQFGNTALQQSLAQQMALRNQPINEVTALMSGSQIQNPQFQQYTGSNVAAAPVFQGVQAQNQAAMDLYGIKQGAANSNMQGITSLAGTAAMAF